jgi:hypothetical protein
MTIVLDQNRELKNRGFKSQDLSQFSILSPTGHPWLMPVILAIQEAEIVIQSQSVQIVHETLS